MAGESAVTKGKIVKFASRNRKYVKMSIAAGLAASVVPSSIAAQVPPMRDQAPGYYRMRVGDFEVTALSDGTAGQPLDKMLENISSERIASLLVGSFQPMPYEFSINSFLINTGSKLILIDAGLGSALEGYDTGLGGVKAGGRLVRNLKAAGYEPDQVDAVLLTHLHVDHVSGLWADGKRVFPNATIFVDKDELSHLDQEEVPKNQKQLVPTARMALAPYIAADRVTKFGSATELFPGLRVIPSPGHSPGHSSYSITSKNETMVFWGDLLHAREIQFRHPEVAFRFDNDKDAAGRQRKRALNDAVESRHWVASSHLSFPGIGHVVAEGDEYDWIPAPYSLRGTRP
jgi:glyoxylase-like metal-dependent hydrolase (beta-lactamase superfamily II)